MPREYTEQEYRDTYKQEYRDTYNAVPEGPKVRNLRERLDALRDAVDEHDKRLSQLHDELRSLRSATIGDN